MALGKTFIAIDSDAIGDGGNFTLLADTWLQRRIQHNLEDVLRRGNAVCLSPYSSSSDDFTSLAGIRPYTALQWHTIWVGYLGVERDQTGAMFTFAYHSTVPGSASDAGDVRVRIVMAGVETLATLGKTYSSGEKTGHQTVEVDFGQAVQRDGVVEVTISVLSELAGTGVSSTLGLSGDGTTGATLEISLGDVKMIETTSAGANAVLAYNSSGTAPDGDSLETMFFDLSKSALVWPNAGYNFYHDLIYSDDLSGNCLGGVVQPLPEPQGPSDLASGRAVRNQCFLLRAFTYEGVFGSSSAPYAQSAQIPESKFASNQSFGASEAAQQAALARRAYLQPRMQLVGPRGRKVNYSVATQTWHDAFDYYGYATHWPMVRGDFNDAAVGVFTDVINDVFWVDTLNPLLELRCLWLSIQVNAPYGVGRERRVEDDGVGKGSRKAFEKGAFQTLQGNGSARWDMTVAVDQMDDLAAGTSTWASNSTAYYDNSASPFSVTIPVHGCQQGAAGPVVPPVLRGAFAMASLGKAVANPPGFWFKEGSMFDSDLTEPLLFDTRHVLSTASMTAAVVNRPLRLKVNMDLDSFTNPITWNTSATLNGQLRLFLVGFSLVEIPVEP